MLMVPVYDMALAVAAVVIVPIDLFLQISPIERC
jgi:hypothetical protein